MDTQNIINQFKAAMLAADIDPPDIINADSARHRFKIDGKPNGFYKLHLDGHPAGCFQNWAMHESPINWKYAGEVKQYTPEEKRTFAQERQAKQAQHEADQRAKHLNAANEAARLWAQAQPATIHPYLTKKRIQPHGARLLNTSLVLPVYDTSLRLMSLQFIAEDGQKRFLPGGMKKGCYWWVGAKSDKLLIAEGFSTASSLFEATGYQCVIAWDAGNLKAVAEMVRAKRPNAHIVICADNDVSGRGQQAANDAALAVNAVIALPPEQGTDFNDFATKLGGGNG
jgi:putative DNA primase/helicase